MVGLEGKPTIPTLGPDYVSIIKLIDRFLYRPLRKGRWVRWNSSALKDIPYRSGVVAQSR